jgi:hypothetical protein
VQTLEDALNPGVEPLLQWVNSQLPIASVFITEDMFDGPLTAPNVLTGNDASNMLSGLDGAETLDGRGGSDILVGGKGDDTYLLGRGYGGEAIQENDTKPGTDVGQFLAAVPDRRWPDVAPEPGAKSRRCDGGVCAPAPGQTDLPPDYAAQLNPTIAANWQ